jgi:hypothetical protein
VLSETGRFSPSSTGNTRSTTPSLTSKGTESSDPSSSGNPNALPALQKATRLISPTLPNILPEFNDAMDFDLRSCGVDDPTLSSTTLDVNHFQEQADVFFYLGLYDQAHYLYRQVLRQLQTLNGLEQNILLAIAACLRSATDISTLSEIVNTHEPLRKLNRHIDSEIASKGELQLSIYDMPELLRILMILDVRKRLLLPTANSVTIYIRSASLVAHLESGLTASEFRQCHFLVWLYIKQMLVHGLSLKEMIPGAESRQVIVGDHRIQHLLATSVGIKLIHNCLDWCEGASQARLTEACLSSERIPESNEWIQDAATFSFLWKGWKRQNFDSKPEILSIFGITPSLFLKAVISVVSAERGYWTKGGFENLSATTAVIDTLKGPSGIYLSALVVGKMHSAWLNTSPHPDADEEILSTLSQYSREPISDRDTTTQSSPQEQIPSKALTDIDALDLPIHVSGINSNEFNDSPIQEADQSTAENSNVPLDLAETSWIEISNDSGRTVESTITPLSTERHADHERPPTFQQAATNVPGNETRKVTGRVTRESWNSWTKSLRSSDGSFKVILATKERSETLHRSALSRTSQSSYSSWLRQMYDQPSDLDVERLSQEMSGVIITSDQRSERVSKGSYYYRSRNTSTMADSMTDSTHEEGKSPERTRSTRFSEASDRMSISTSTMI